MKVIKYFLIKTDGKTNISSIYSTHNSLTETYNTIEEIIETSSLIYQGMSEPTYVRTKCTTNTYNNTEGWYSDKSYGFFVQRFDNPYKLVCWNRNRTIGFLFNRWNDEKIFELNIVQDVQNVQQIPDNRFGYQPLNDFLKDKPNIKEIMDELLGSFEKEPKTND
jgi:hypothetical protein